jgi:hypothetical protein
MICLLHTWALFPPFSLLSAELSYTKAHSRYSGLPQREPPLNPIAREWGVIAGRRADGSG